jgi:hypothetical protein
MDWELFLQIITGVAAVAAAVIAGVMAWQAKQAILTGVMCEFKKDYGRPEILRAMNQLALYKARHSDFAERIEKGRYGDDEEAVRLDEYRREVSHLIQRPAMLVSADLIKEQAFKSIVPITPAAFFIDVIEPIERAINPHYDKTPFDLVHRVYTRDELDTFRKHFAERIAMEIGKKRSLGLWRLLIERLHCLLVFRM